MFRTINRAEISEKNPKGYGDPEDKSLRKVEKDVMIAGKVRDKARNEKCIPEVAAFTECCKNATYLMTFKCKAENEVLKACLIKWYENEEFREQCTQEYLAERSEYRRTGVGKGKKKATQTI